MFVAIDIHYAQRYPLTVWRQLLESLRDCQSIRSRLQIWCVRTSEPDCHRFTLTLHWQDWGFFFNLTGL